MMSLPVWLTDPMFLPGGLCLWSHAPSTGWGSLSKGSLSENSGRYASYWNAFLLSLIPSILCGILAVSFIELYFRLWFKIITVRNEVAKAVFLHLSVCPRGVCLSACWDTTPPLGSRHPPPSRRLLLRTVRILLECILVYFK